MHALLFIRDSIYKLYFNKIKLNWKRYTAAMPLVAKLSAENKSSVILEENLSYVKKIHLIHI